MFLASFAKSLFQSETHARLTIGFRFGYGSGWVGGGRGFEWAEQTNQKSIKACDAAYPGSDYILAVTCRTKMQSHTQQNKREL